MPLKHHFLESLEIARQDFKDLIKWVTDEDTDAGSYALVRTPWSPPSPLDEQFQQLPGNAGRDKIDSVVKGLLNRTFGSYQLAQALLMFGYRQGLLEAYHSEAAVQRTSQRLLRDDRKRKKVLSEVKDGYVQELMQLKGSGSPFSGAQNQARITHLENRLHNFSRLTKSPSKYLPRGMIARISLLLMGGPAAHWASDVMCSNPDCQEISGLAVCCMCSRCICSRRRVIVSDIKYKGDSV